MHGQSTKNTGATLCGLRGVLTIELWVTCGGSNPRLLNPPMELNMTERYAPAGKIWFCMMCGKTTMDCYGDERGGAGMKAARSIASLLMPPRGNPRRKKRRHSPKSMNACLRIPSCASKSCSNNFRMEHGSPTPSCWHWRKKQLMRKNAGTRQIMVLKKARIRYEQKIQTSCLSRFRRLLLLKVRLHSCWPRCSALTCASFPVVAGSLAELRPCRHG